MKRFVAILIFVGLLYFVAACALPALWRVPGLDTFYIGLNGPRAEVGSFNCWLLYPAFSLICRYYVRYRASEPGFHFYPFTWELCLLASGLGYGLVAASTVSVVRHFRHPHPAA
jgi:hypothetical protein